MSEHELKYSATSAARAMGLTNEEAKERLNRFGPNSIVDSSSFSVWKILLHQFHNPMSYLLLGAAGLSFYFHEWLDGSAISAVILINAAIGFGMEVQAERSMQALKRLVVLPARVVRDGRVMEIPSHEVVPGDILSLEAGDMVAADATIQSSAMLQADESALTGESLPVEKSVDPVPEGTPLAERTNMIFKGTHITNGNGTAVVEATGMKTELGRIAGLVQRAKQAATPLEKKLQVFSRKLIWITLGLLVIILVVGLINGADLFELIETAIALAVAAIPEGLPIVATLALAQGMLKMARKNVIVKKLAAVETLGGTDVICTDKTGTLTQNKIEVSVVSCGNGTLEVEQIRKGKDIQFRRGAELIETPEFERLLQIATLCNTAEYIWDENGEHMVGDPLETGLLQFVHHTGIDLEGTRNGHPKEAEIPFSSELKMMVTEHRSGTEYWAAAKGALDELLAKCTHYMTGDELHTLQEEDRRSWVKRGESLASKGLRVLGFAWKHTDHTELTSEELIFSGMIGFLDPPAQGVKEALNDCREAGIEVKMITGDHPATALNIGDQLGLVHDTDRLVMVGKDMAAKEELTENDRERWLGTQVFARVDPAHKLDLIAVLQDDGHVVAMTGDGVNDAPALKKSDIGIAMGIRGTQVAQEASDMVLKDDSFASIVHAIRQGRIIFENIRKFVVFLLSCNLSELFVVATASLMNLHFQLLPLQILFINLITDVLPALALGVSEGSDKVMQDAPRSPDEPIISSSKWRSIWIFSLVISMCTMGAVTISHYVLHPLEDWNPELCNNILFVALISGQLFHVFNMNDSGNWLNNEVTRNKHIWRSIITCVFLVIVVFNIPVVAEALHLGTMGAWDMTVAIGAGFAAWIINLALKKLALT